MVLDELDVPIVQAPMAGGPSTPALAAAVSDAGGLGFVAAGYKSPDAFATSSRRRARSPTRPFGVEPLRAAGATGDPAAVAALRRVARRPRRGPLGEPRSDDDGFDAKLDAARRRAGRRVSFTFGAPRADVVERLRAAGARCGSR